MQPTRRRSWGPCALRECLLEGNERRRWCCIYGYCLLPALVCAGQLAQQAVLHGACLAPPTWRALLCPSPNQTAAPGSWRAGWRSLCCAARERSTRATCRRCPTTWSSAGAVGNVWTCSSITGSLRSNVWLRADRRCCPTSCSCAFMAACCNATSPPLLLLPCRPTKVQLRLYSSVLGSGVVRKMLSATGSDFGDTVSAGP